MMKGKIEKRKKTGHVILAMLMAVIMAFSTYGIGPLRAEEQDVQVNVANMKNIDVLLSKGKTRADISNFESDLTTALKERGIPTEYVHFIKNDSVTMVGQSGFNQYTWTFNSTTGNSGSRSTGYGDSPGPSATTVLGRSSLGQFGFCGPDLELVGNDRLAGNMILYSSMPENVYKYTMDFDYTSNFGDNFNGAGVFLQSEFGSSNSGILICIKGTYGSFPASGVYRGTINANGTFSASTSYASIATNGHLAVEVTNGSVKVNGTEIPGTYEGTKWGFFTSQYSHGCSQTGRFLFSNLKVNIETTKEFRKVLTEEQNSWHSGYEHVFVDIVDDLSQTATQKTSSDYYEVLNMLNAADVHLAGWGTDSNASVMKSYVNTISAGGIFCNMGTYNSTAKQMSNYQSCINDTAVYIAGLLNYGTSADTVICDEPTSITITPNTARANKSWGFKHDNTKLTADTPLVNDTGVSVYNGTSGITFPEDFTFDKPGFYTIYYNNKEVKTVTAHRRPTAGIRIVGRTATSSTSTIFNYTFESSSYDLDSTKDNGLGGGIAHLTWSSKENEKDAVVQTGAQDKKQAVIPIDVSKNTTVYITATDMLGATDTTSITINASSKPVATFTVDKTPIRQDEAISLTDNSYDPMQRAITQRTWTVMDSAGKVYYTASGADPATVIPSFKPYEKNMKGGTYTISLKVKNDNNTYSYEYKQSLDVRKYYITYSANGGTNAPERGEADYKDTYTVTNAVPTRAQGQATKTVNIDLQGGTLSGKTGTVKQNAVFPITYTLDHWTGSDGKSYKAGQTLTITGDMTMQAGWKGTIEKGTFVSATPTKARYKFLGYGKTPGDSTSAVTYKAGGAVSYNDITEGGTFFAIWTGKKFVGWNTKADGSGTWYKPCDGAPQANLDLYAQWEFPDS